MGRRTYFNKVLAITYPSRIEGWLDVCESEGEVTRKQRVTLPWGPLYCVLQQDEQSFTAYCSEEISILSATPRKELTDVMCNEYPRVRLDRIRRPAKLSWDGPPTLREEPEDSDTSPMDVAVNTTFYKDLGKW
ncbi:ras GTPase-activating protein raskol-like [Glossina fuscipes fuscipes]